MRWNDPIYIPRPVVASFALCVAVGLLFAASQIVWNFTDDLFGFFGWAVLVFFAALAVVAVFLNLRSTESPRARGIALAAVFSGFVILSIINLNPIILARARYGELFDPYQPGSLIVEFLLTLAATISCLWVLRWPPMVDWKANQPDSTDWESTDNSSVTELDFPIAIGRNRISAEMNTSRLVEAGGKISIMQVDRDILADIPMAPVASLFLLLLVVIRLIQDGSGPAGFQKELRPASILPHQIRVEIDRSDRIAINGVLTNKNAIYEDMASIVSTHRKQGQTMHIALHADYNASFESVIKVLDAAREAGDDDVRFVSNGGRIRH
jgi:biopolymer transport protein ExbD